MQAAVEKCTDLNRGTTDSSCFRLTIVSDDSSTSFTPCFARILSHWLGSRPCTSMIRKHSSCLEGCLFVKALGL